MVVASVYIPMRIPQVPPTILELLNRGVGDKLNDILSSGIGKLPSDRYLHWDELRRRPVPDQNFNCEEWWLATKLARSVAQHKLPFTDKNGKHFFYTESGYLYRLLHKIDQDASGGIGMPEHVTSSEERNRYLARSIMEEAITSSQLEGAVTTRRVAKEMLRSGRQPRNQSERMIYNNYHAMEFARELSNESLSIPMILELQRIVLDDTDHIDAAGRFRYKSENVRIVDVRYQEIFHIPPDADEIPSRMERLIKFANNGEDEEFIHPVVRSIVLHFMIGYDHPFVDGNGRTARALFYWSMARSGYWLTEFLSISTILRKAPVKYARAYLFTETDENDVTYFLDYNLRVIIRSLLELKEYLARKVGQIRNERLLLEEAGFAVSLNHRQLALLGSMRTNPDLIYTIESHRRSHGVTYQTARTDLLKLVELRLLESDKSGRKFTFRLKQDFGRRLFDLASQNQNNY